MYALTFLALTTTALAAIHTVEVGESGLTFEPERVSAAEGDTVIFTFYPTHDVAQSSFDSPCTPSDGGIYSGSFGDTDNGKKKFVMQVNSTDPIYYYCSVQRHCQDGMIGGINTPEDGDQSLDNYKQAAAGVQSSDAPDDTSGGELLEDEQVASLTQSGASASATASQSSASGTAASSATTTAASSSGAASSAAASGSGTAASASPSSTGAADIVNVGQVNGVLAMVLGFAAWLL